MFIDDARVVMISNFVNNISINKNLDINGGIQTFTGSISWANTDDYYSLNLSNRSSFKVTVDGLSANLNMEVLDRDGTVVAGSYNRRRWDESITATLDQGSYYIKVYRAGHGASDYNLKFNSYAIATSVNSVDSWFDTNIQDTEIRTLAESAFADKAIDRNEAIAILSSSKDSDVIDPTEFADLKTLVGNASVLGIPDYVKVLANKVVNGDYANQQYQGNPLGNLAPGSSSTQMENLINKWFLGSDRPTTPYQYQSASGSLFQDGISYQDIKQGQINDCFLLVGLAATAIHSPSTIAHMFVDNGDNTFTVRFQRSQTVVDYVTVDRHLPTNSSGSFVYASKGNLYNNPGNELWVALAEKAYAQLNESGWINQNNTNSYSGIGNGGYISDTLTHITGYNTSLGNLLNFDSIVNAINSGEWIGLGTKSTVQSANIIAGHAYTLVAYNSDNQKFTLFNPWGIGTSSSKPGILEFTWSEIQSNFSYWDATKIYA
jgi:Calpain family cysteine protease/Bacterial pre-peptidase C-terminal domain